MSKLTLPIQFFLINFSTLMNIYYINEKGSYQWVHEPFF